MSELSIDNERLNVEVEVSSQAFEITDQLGNIIEITTQAAPVITASPSGAQGPPGVGTQWSSINW